MDELNVSAALLLLGMLSDGYDDYQAADIVRTAKNNPGVHVAFSDRDGGTSTIVYANSGMMVNRG